MPDAPAAAPAGPSPATAAPAAAPAPAAPSPTPAGPAAPATGGEPDPFDAIDQRIAANRKKEAPAKPDKKPDETPAAPAAPAAPDDKPGDKGIRNLRTQLEKTGAELTSTKSELAQLRGKIQDYEARGKDTEKLTSRMAALEKEKEALQAEIRGLRHEASPEIQDRFTKPFNRAADAAKEIVEQLNTVEETAADGSLIQSRPATWNDFVAIYSLPYGKAYGEAKRVFGEHATMVMQQYSELHRMQREQKAAVDEEKAGFKAREEAEAARRAGEMEVFKATATKVLQDVMEKGGDAYQADPKSDDEKGLVSDATALLAAKPATLQQRIVRDAHVRAKVIGYYLAQHRLGAAKARIAELEAKLAERRGSAPGETRHPAGEGGGDGEKPWKDDLRDSMS